MFRPSMLAIFMLYEYTKNLPISYTNVCREFTVCGVRWVWDLVLCSRKGVDWSYFGDCIKPTSMYTYSNVYKWVTIWYVQFYIGNYIIYELSVKGYGIV